MRTRLHVLGVVGQACMHQAKSSRRALRADRKADIHQEADLALVRRLLVWWNISTEGPGIKFLHYFDISRPRSKMYFTITLLSRIGFWPPDKTVHTQDAFCSSSINLFSTISKCSGNLL
jgi:hypothetical protein